jgi:hypothetical protein
MTVDVWPPAAGVVGGGFAGSKQRAGAGRLNAVEPGDLVVNYILRVDLLAIALLGSNSPWILQRLWQAISAEVIT